MNKEQAINYLYSSGMTDEQVRCIVKALSGSAEKDDPYELCWEDDPYELCWETGKYQNQDCDFCPHNFDCSGAEVDDNE